MVCWYRKALMPRTGSVENDVAAHLMHVNVLPTLAEDVSQLFAGYVAREFHATDIISSRKR